MFGKQGGISWHISCVLLQGNATENNEGNTGLQLVTYILQMLHESQPHLRKVYMKCGDNEQSSKSKVQSDNAGCYGHLREDYSCPDKSG